MPGTSAPERGDNGRARTKQGVFSSVVSAIKSLFAIRSAPRGGEEFVPSQNAIQDAVDEASDVDVRLIECGPAVCTNLNAMCSVILEMSALPKSEWDTKGGERLLALVRERRLSGDTVARLAKLAFKIRYVSNPELVPFGLSLSELLSAIRDSDAYMSSIAEHGLLANLDLAAPFLSEELQLLDPDGCVVACEQHLSESFAALVVQEPYCLDKSGVHLWGRYLMVAVQVCRSVPASLLEYVRGDRTRRCSITSYLSKCIKCYRKWDWASEAEKARFVEYAEAVLLAIVDADPSDHVALFELAQLYEGEERYGDAEQCYHEAVARLESQDEANHESYCKLVMSSIKCQERMCKKAAFGGDRKRAGEIARGIIEQYDSLIACAESNGVESDGFKQGLARFQKNRKDFAGAQRTLQSMQDGFRKYLELGMLHSSDNLKRHRYGYLYLDYDKAVSFYVKAWNALKDSGQPVDPRAKMTVLHPLASALFNAGRKQESYDVCLYAKTIRKEPRVDALLRRLEGDGLFAVPSVAPDAVPPLLASNPV